MSDDEIDINPRSPAEAGRRLIILASLLRRGFLEQDIATDALGTEVEEERFDILAWLDDNGIIGDLTETERELLSAQRGWIDDFDIYEFLMPIEELLAVAWYLKLLDELPDYLIESTHRRLLETIPSPWDEVAPWLKGLESRSLDELAVERERAEIWNWRSIMERSRTTTTGKDLQNLDDAIRETSIEAVNAGLLPKLIDNDFPAGEQAYRSLDADDQDVVEVSSYDRLRALNWLCGYGTNWSDTPTDI